MSRNQDEETIHINALLESAEAMRQNEVLPDPVKEVLRQFGKTVSVLLEAIEDQQTEIQRVGQATAWLARHFGAACTAIGMDLTEYPLSDMPDLIDEIVRKSEEHRRATAH